jgi:GNAT superfamily N-acetyltransferase
VTRPSINLARLAQHPHLVSQVGEMRWREWGHEEASPERWTQITARENESNRLPMTLVAIDELGRAAGAVALGKSDDALMEGERSGRSPWLLGMVVRSDCRGLGVGRRLSAAVEELAGSKSFSVLWVATGPDAVAFYRRCGWTDEEELRLIKGGWQTFILSKVL